MKIELQPMKPMKLFISDVIAKSVQEIAEKAEDIAKQEITTMGFVNEPTDLISSIHIENGSSPYQKYLVADGGYALFYEYGTGVVGSRSSHPSGLGIYDVNSHGDKGWVYFNTRYNSFIRTKGMNGRPFLWNTKLKVEEIAGKIVKQTFDKDRRNLR